MAIANALLTGALFAGLPVWEFNGQQESSPEWHANDHIERVAVRDGSLQGEATGWDPMFVCDDLSFPAQPWQYVVLRIKADIAGSGELFWTGNTTGPYGGFTPQKKTPFRVRGDNAWQEVILLPFWQSEGTIHKLRLDLYQDAKFQIDSIRVESWVPPDAAPETRTAWTFSESDSPWRLHAANSDYYSPPLKIRAKAFRWVTIGVRSPHAGVGRFVWVCDQEANSHSQEFVVKEDSESQIYNLEVQNAAGWSGDIRLLGVHLPRGALLESMALGKEPQGPARLEVVSLGPGKGVQRVGKATTVELYLKNVGGSPAQPTRTELQLPTGLRLRNDSAQKTIPLLAPGQQVKLAWTVVANQPNRYELRVRARQKMLARGSVRFDPAVQFAPAAYVPPPRPVLTDIEVCAFYFPGFSKDEKWAPIRATAPIRKPLLGWYDEGNPECVDWQIKWARENGIGTFLVDWYWVRGRQQLTHWFEAYRQARYRDQLQVAIMWANHNPPNTHSRDDWDRVTREWIEHYFSLPGYYRIDGKPAVFLWDPRRLREDLVQKAPEHAGGDTPAPSSTDLVRKALEHSRQLARKAGYPGITFVAMAVAMNGSRSDLLAHEGYDAFTMYHEWGRATQLGPSPLRSRYQDVVATAPGQWSRWLQAAGSLQFYPTVDTGWDARPWHGAKARVIGGRTPARFERLLREAKAFAEKQKIPRVILGPLNEWGEGSYIEPCAEYGFEMIEQIRNVFATRNPKSWPVNIGPADVGLGPYEYGQANEMLK